MGVSVDISANVAPFKAGMTQAAAASKTLESALKANEKQLKATGDKDTYLQQKTNLLNQQMLQQQAIAKNAESALKAMADGGVQKTSVAYQQLQAKMYDAYGAMNNIQAQLNDIETGSEGAATSADKLSDSVSSIGTKMSLDQVISGIDRITTGLENAAKKVVNFGQEMWNTMSDAAGWADDLATEASMYGITETELQQMRYAAELIDTPVETIIKSRNKLAQNMKYGSQDAMDVFALLGISVGTNTGKGGEVSQLRDWEDVFWETGEALMTMGDNAEAEAQSMKVFGKSWDEMKPLFRMSEEDFAQYGSARERYAQTMKEAPVVSDDDVNKLTELDDSLQKLDAQFNTMKETVFASLAPAFTTISDSLSGLMAQFNEYLQSDDGKAMMESLGESVKSLFEGLGNIDFGTAIQSVSNGINSVTGALQWIHDNQSLVIGAMEAIVGGWAALKITGGALQIVNLINGISGLSGGGAAAAGAAAGESWGGAVAKAAPWLVGIYTLINPAETGNDDLFDENGNLTPLAITSGLTEEDAEEYRNSIKEAEAWNQRLAGSEYGPLTVDQYDKMQWLWDMYRDPSKADKFTEYYKGTEALFEGTNNRSFLSMMNEMYNLRNTSPDMEDLPDDFFKLPVKPEMDTEAAQTQLNEAGLTVDVGVRFNFGDLSGGPEYEGTGLDRRHHANGLSFVPYDGYLAVLHQGERIMTAAANRQYTANSYLNVGTMNMNSGLDAESLVSQLNAQSRQTMAGFGSR